MLVVAAKHTRTGGTTVTAWMQLMTQTRHASGGTVACLS
jgi:hypothetical protein